MFALDLNTNAYEEIISTVKGDLLLVENQKKEFTPISELKQIDSLLNTLDQNSATYQILPKLDSRRGLIDFGGTILRTLFGTATLTDLHSLHETLDELKSRDSDIAHSLITNCLLSKFMYLLLEVVIFILFPFNIIGHIQLTLIKVLLLYWIAL